MSRKYSLKKKSLLEALLQLKAKYVDLAISMTTVGVLLLEFGRL
jgi:hypothetical protein